MASCAHESELWLAFYVLFITFQRELDIPGGSSRDYYEIAEYLKYNSTLADFYVCRCAVLFMKQSLSIGCRSPPQSIVLKNSNSIGWEENIMAEEKYAKSKCFILSPDGYEEITYTELCHRRDTDETYKTKKFIPLHGMLMEVTPEQYIDFYRTWNRQRYLDKPAPLRRAISP